MLGEKQRREKKEVGDYHDTSYYRANPYAKQNYQPPCANNNRKPKQYAVEMPQGNDPFLSGQRKIFPHELQKSQINQFKLFVYAKTPFENKRNMVTYGSRNLDTKDIQGAAPNTKINQSLKNRLRAQQYIMLRGQPVKFTRQESEFTLESPPIRSLSLSNIRNQGHLKHQVSPQHQQKETFHITNRRSSENRQDSPLKVQKQSNNMLHMHNEKSNNMKLQREMKPKSRQTHSFANLTKPGTEMRDSLDHQVSHNSMPKSNQIKMNIDTYAGKQIRQKLSLPFKNNIWQSEVDDKNRYRNLNPTNLSSQAPYYFVNAAKNSLMA